jgi:hypothetical protein
MFFQDFWQPCCQLFFEWKASREVIVTWLLLIKVHTMIMLLKRSKIYSREVIVTWLLLIKVHILIMLLKRSKIYSREVIVTWLLLIKVHTMIMLLKRSKIYSRVGFYFICYFVGFYYLSHNLFSNEKLRAKSVSWILLITVHILIMLLKRSKIYSREVILYPWMDICWLKYTYID